MIKKNVTQPYVEKPGTVIVRGQVVATGLECIYAGVRTSNGEKYVEIMASFLLPSREILNPVKMCIFQ